MPMMRKMGAFKTMGIMLESATALFQMRTRVFLVKPVPSTRVFMLLMLDVICSIAL